MPKRPRSHQLETEHRLAFERLIHAAGWVYRSIFPDYGIDGQVEIFREERTTGLVFWVQLKATDKADRGTGLTVRLRAEVCAYYQSLESPVLIARYHAASGRMYARWFHEFDLSAVKTDAKSIALRLQPEDLWADSTPRALLAALEVRRELHSTSLRLPIRIKLDVDGGEWRGHAAGALASAIRREAAHLNSIVQIGLNIAEPHIGRVIVSDDHTVVWIGTERSITIHDTDRYDPSCMLRSQACDTLVAVACLLGIYGHRELAANILIQPLKNCWIKRVPEFAVGLVICLASSGYVERSFDLMEELLEQGSGESAVLTLLGMQMQHARMLEGREASRLVRLLNLIIARAEAQNDPRESAIAHYNLGNLIRRENPRAALTHYRAAAAADSAYLERAYWWRETGGLLFMNKRYAMSAKFYGRAVELGEEDECGALYADALLLSGRYKKAEDVFATYMLACKQPEAEWILKLWTLPHIREFAGTDDQKRRSGEANQRVHDAVVLDGEWQETALREALSIDALCGWAWFNLGGHCYHAGQYSSACRCYLAAALIDSHDEKAWCNATVAAMLAHGECNAIIRWVLEAAYRAHGEAFLDEMTLMAEGQPNQALVGPLIDLINSVVEEIGPHRSPFKIRFLGPENSFEVDHM